MTVVKVQWELGGALEVTELVNGYDASTGAPLTFKMKAIVRDPEKIRQFFARSR